MSRARLLARHLPRLAGLQVSPALLSACHIDQPVDGLISRRRSPLESTRGTGTPAVRETATLLRVGADCGAEGTPAASVHNALPAAGHTRAGMVGARN